MQKAGWKVVETFEQKYIFTFGASAWEGALPYTAYKLVTLPKPCTWIYVFK